MAACVEFKASGECWRHVWLVCLHFACLGWSHQVGLSYYYQPKKHGDSFLAAFDWGSFKASSGSSVADEGARPKQNWIRIVMCKTGPACSLVKRLVNWQDLSMTSECTLQDWQLGFTAWQAEFQVPLSWNTRAQSVDIMCFADSTSKSFIGRYKPFVNVEWRGMAGLQNEA